MKKPNGYENAATFSGATNWPSAGAYVFGITKAETTLSSNNNEMLVLSLDIIEGDFSGFYRDQSLKFGKDRTLKHRRLTDSEKSLPYLKGDIKAIEESNPGFKFNFDELTLRGKKVGGMLREEEYERNDGSIGSSLKIAFLCSVDKVKSGELKTPEPKLMIQGQGQAQQFTTNTANTTDDDDLPF